MKNTFLNMDDFLFDEEISLTEITEFGYSWKEFTEKPKNIPAEGLRFDMHFEGKVSGEKIKGTIKGVDHLTVRSDGRLFLDLHATIKTSDNALIKVTENGINENGKLRLNMDFHSNDSRYSWLNKKHGWGVGKVDFQTGKVNVKGYLN